MVRLSLRTLPLVAPAARPPVDPGEVGVGIVHLGIGAFHRAHQAAFTQDAMAATGDLGWGICGVTQRSTDVLDQLGPQDGLYSVLVRTARGADVQVSAAVRELLFARADPDALTARLADPRVRVVTLTVTEKGYRHDPATRRLRTDDPEVVADLGGRAPRTVVGQLVRGLQARHRADAGPVTLLSCDNLPSNGEVLAGLVREFCAALPAGEGGPLLDWVRDSVAFPSSMVDRIVPATTDDDRRDAARLLGIDDEGVVATEPFRQWVVEDSFAAGRPVWERAGAVLTADVTPYEAMKLRLLNGSHSTLAYLGGLAGHPYVADAVADPGLREVVERLMRDEVTPTLQVPDGFDLAGYQADLVQRFSNPALRHRTAQVAMDGSQKLPQRQVAVARDLLAVGVDPRLACLGIAAWMRYATAGTAEDGSPLVLDDPLADRIAQVTASASTPQAVVDAFLSLGEVFGDDLPHDERFRGLLVDGLSALTSGGVGAAVRAALG
ncbi:fructuronate reductase [Motilibacter peucedani]|uniref:Mannitol-1-phosphate 5-dehydrogenase n=1 Tax=Motilibacter peucedani TaxID=598650 RepID=A0A420XVA6_9ACTN|nr:mannitol dehydrogenase family protein [Motilibacter peucedani]RKS84217.1 fructuronate reductase [Motilibacter peucedani]